ncbi:MlaD family protein [bacterium]|nr:MCE family protein [bacterium]MBU4561283.1 MCE family protein [bacterium]MCG2676531.1 MlaD family protein [bacterium]
MRFFTNEVKVGIAVAIAIVILIFSAFIVEKGEVRGFRTREYTIKVIFNFVGGLTETAPVRLAGVKVGQVDKIRFIQEPTTKVETTISLKEVVQLREDAQFSITTVGLLGEKYIEITPGSLDTPIIEPGAILVGQDAVDIGEVFTSAGEAMEDLGGIISSVRGGKGTVGKLVTDKELSDNLSALIKNLREVSEEVKEHPWKLFREKKEKKK